MKDMYIIVLLQIFVCMLEDNKKSNKLHILVYAYIQIYISYPNLYVQCYIISSQRGSNMFKMVWTYFQMNSFIYYY